MNQPSRAPWVLKLYVAGQTPRSVNAIENLQRICREHLADEYELQVIDLTKTPTLAKDDQIVALPALVRQLPQPLKQIIGDLSDTERVLVGLDVRPRH